MFRKAVGAATGLAGASIELMEVAIFGGITGDVLLDELFKPLGGAMIGATIPGPFLGQTTGEKIMGVLGYVPTAAASAAIFAFGGTPTAPLLFVPALTAGATLTAADMAYKGYRSYYYNEPINKADMLQSATKIAKTVAMVVTLTPGVDTTGKILGMAKDGAVPLAYKISSGIAAGLAGLSGAYGLFKSGKAALEVASEACVVEAPVKPQDYQLLDEERMIRLGRVI